VEQVLVIESNGENLKQLHMAFAQGDYRVRVVGPGEIGLLTEGEPQPDVILVNIDLPGIDPPAAKRRIENCQKRKIPLVAITSQPSATDRERVLAAGFAACLSLPIEPQQLLKVLDKCQLSKGRVATLASEETLPPPAFSELTDLPEIPDQIEHLDVAQGLRRLQGKRRLYGKILYTFVWDNRNRCAELRRALDERDLQHLGELAHRLRGTTGVIGATRAFQAAAALEMQLEQGKRDVDFLVERLCRELQQVVQSLQLIFHGY
jgi:two-component system, sensor histidine kinase and response regulator